MKKTTQEKIATSRYALPVTMLACAALLLAGGEPGQGTYVRTAATLLSALLMMTLNNSYSLIRIYSRMVSCTFLVLATMQALVPSSLSACAVQMCFIAAFLLLFGSYQDSGATGRVFYAFAFVGVSSLFFVQALFLAPFLWFSMAAYLMVFGARPFCASLLGLAAPYWLASGYLICTGGTSWIWEHLAGIASFGTPLSFGQTDTGTLATLVFTLLLGSIGITHFIRNSYKDKIKTRMLYDTLMLLAVATVLFIPLQPQHTGMLLAILAVPASVLAGHFLALTHTRATNAATLLLIAGAMAVILLNIHGAAR